LTSFYLHSQQPLEAGEVVEDPDVAADIAPAPGNDLAAIMNLETENLADDPVRFPNLIPNVNSQIPSLYSALNPIFGRKNMAVNVPDLHVVVPNRMWLLRGTVHLVRFDRQLGAAENFNERSDDGNAPLLGCFRRCVSHFFARTCQSFKLKADLLLICIIADWFWNVRDR